MRPGGEGLPQAITLRCNMDAAYRGTPCVRVGRGYHHIAMR